MHVKLADAVTQEETIEVGVRPALHALKCDACGTIFTMAKFSPNDTALGQMHCTFNNQHGTNVFNLHVCSFHCAHELMTGGWRKHPDLQHHAEADVQLVRAELRITSLVLSEALIRSKWQTVDRFEANKRRAMEMWSEPDE